MLNQDPTLSKTSIMGTSTAPLSNAPSVLINDNNNMNDDNNNINGENTGNNNNNNKLLYTILPSPIQGNADWRKYKCLKLNNGITVCLVNDKESKTTSAAVTVTAGAADDPRSMSGLARKFNKN